MASKPWYSKHRKQWLMRYRPDPNADWVTVPLGKHPTAVNADRPPKRAPIEIQDRAREFTDLEYRVANGLAPVPQQARSLAEYLDAYVAGYGATHKPGSVLLVKRYANNFKAFAAAQGVKTIQAVTKAHCRDYLESRTGTVSPNGLRTEKGYLGAIWSRAVDDGLIQVSPWYRLRPPGKKTDPPPTFWTPAEIQRIADKAPSPWLADCILLMASTGLRVSAALAVEWAWIDWAGGTMKVPKEADKAGFGYTHVLGVDARAILERRHFGSDSPLCFPHPRTGGRITYGSAEKSLKRAIRYAGVPHGHAHDFRHSYARRLERAGVPLSVIQRQLGHRSLSHTHLYSTAGEEEVGGWIGKADGRRGRHVTPPAETSPPASDGTSRDPAIDPSPASD